VQLAPAPGGRSSRCCRNTSRLDDSQKRAYFGSTLTYFRQTGSEMLRRLTIENFYSIADVQTLDLEIARNAPDPDERFARPIPTSDARFPKVVVLFGANASGKTNVLRALAFLLEFVRNSADWRPESPMLLLPFAGDPWTERLTRFLVEFDARVLEEHEQRVRYIYELEIASHANIVKREALIYHPYGRKRRLFERIGLDIRSGADFGLGKRDPVRTKIRENASVISMLARFNHRFATALYNNIQAVMTNITLFGERMSAPPRNATDYYVKNTDALSSLTEQIKTFDIGIEKIKMEPAADGIQPIFFHRGIRVPLSLVWESQGTKNIYNLYPYLWFVLKSGSVAVIDEIDNDIHPLILPELIRTFQGNDTNKSNAQLIISCHNATLLEYLVKEETYFTDKDSLGRTHIYGLKDVQGVRRDTNIYAKYLAGAFGAVPRLG
jgi:hypothetical protein